ncbi:polysaccharide lyase [Algoriphagus sp. NG3]|uniref:polysaccharide lyase n=1 Tax=Algoriphagus sp. NG3 TaxID=3097546 RepID=UPI002A7FC263|nr:hypothetical protein [Algoriphagus sp. NG3]WPR73549.1 hypothetical protein SLW71_12760 [Algoriphagus sp. NG3]
MKIINIVVLTSNPTLVLLVTLVSFIFQINQANFILVKVNRSMSQISGSHKTVSESNTSEWSDLEPDWMHDDFVIFKMIDFEDHQVGDYTNSQFRKDWKSNRELYQPNTSKIMSVDDKKVLGNYYPQGTWGRGGGLNQWVRISPYVSDIEEIYMTYRIKFQKEFDWGLVGKLPGFSLGPVQTVASGGDGPNIGNKGASTRMLWLENGKLCLYVYHHNMKYKYGDDMGIGSFGQLVSGIWHEVTLRIVCNDVGKENGIMQVWLDGKLVATSNKIELRTERSPQHLEEIAISTFMGGADVRFASAKDQFMFIDDIYIWKYSESYLARNPSVPYGQNLHIISDKLYNPLQIQQ